MFQIYYISLPQVNPGVKLLGFLKRTCNTPYQMDITIALGRYTGDGHRCLLLSQTEHKSGHNRFYPIRKSHIYPMWGRMESPLDKTVNQHRKGVPLCSSGRHRWELPVGNYHGNSGNYHYPFFG